MPQLACNILATTYKYYFRAQLRDWLKGSSQVEQSSEFKCREILFYLVEREAMEDIRCPSLSSECC